MKIKKETMFWIAITVFALIKLLLINQNEIVAIPYDSIQYVRHARDSLLQLGPAPGYPFWLSLTQLTGIPQRLSIELFFLFSCLSLAVVMRRNLGRVAGVLVFAAIVISPATFFMFDSALSDGFYSCLSIIALACSLFIISSVRFSRVFLGSAALGVLLGMMALTRNEDPILFLWGSLVFLAVILFRRRVSVQNGELKWWHLGAVALTMIFTASALIQLVNAIHYVKSGVYARSVAALPGHMKLLSNLTRIDTGEVNMRYVPISSKARILAYAASPTLRKVQSWIEDRDGPYQVASRANGIADGEVGAGWTWHIFNHAILESLRTNDAKIWENEYRVINDELDSAFMRGQLKQRFVWHPFLTAPFFEIISRAPVSIWSVFKKSFHAHEYTEDLGYEEAAFDEVAMRRTALVTGGYSYSVQGWAFVNAVDQKIRSIDLHSEDGESMGGVMRMDRVDVQKTYGKINGWQPSVVGFRMDVKSRSRKPLMLSYILEDGSRIDNLSGPIVPGVQKLSGTGSLQIVQGIDYANLNFKERKNWQQLVQIYFVDLLNRSCFTPIFVIFIIGFLLIALGISKSARAIGSKALIFSCFILLSIFSRILFYGLLESEAWVVEVRYMLTANLMAMAAVGIFVSLIINFVRAKFYQPNAVLLQKND